MSDLPQLLQFCGAPGPWRAGRPACYLSNIISWSLLMQAVSWGGGEGRVLCGARGVAQVLSLCRGQLVGGDKLPVSETQQGWRPLSRHTIADHRGTGKAPLLRAAGPARQKGWWGQARAPKEPAASSASDTRIFIKA